MVNATNFQNKGRYINSEKMTTVKELKNTLVIMGVTEEEMQDGKSKLCIVFDGLQDIEEVHSGLVLNQTNLNTMISAKGGDTNAWKGAEIKLSLVPVSFAGKMQKSVVITSVV